MKKELISLKNKFEEYRDDYCNKVDELVLSHLDNYILTISEKDIKTLERENVLEVDWGVTLDVAESSLIKAKCTILEINYNEYDNACYDFGFQYKQHYFTCSGNTENGCFIISYSTLNNN